MMIFSALFLLFLVKATLASSSSSFRSSAYVSSSNVVDYLSSLITGTHVFHRKAHVPTIGMAVSYGSLVKDEELHTVVIAVKRRNMQQLQDLVYDISNPYHKKYGQHMTRDEIATMISNPTSLQHIKSYLEQQNHPQLRIVKESRYGDYLTVEGPVSVWNRMFQTKLQHVSVRHFMVEEKDEEHSFLRGKEYSLPIALKGHVQEVFNLVQIPPAVQKHQKIYNRRTKDTVTTVTGAFDNQVTPDLLNSYYHITNNTGNHLIEQAVYESLNQSSSPSDLKQFQETFQIPVQALSGVINGHVANTACEGSDGIDGCGEANLDVQYLMGVAQNIPTLYYYWGGADFMLDWVTQVADMQNPPEIFSISYGAYEVSYDASYLAAFDQEAIILAGVGTTIFVSSGDDGVAGYVIRNLPAFCDYYPQFPASSPMVTTVGATNGPQANRTEVVCQSNENGALITSGGGFSDVYPQPSWQTKQVEQYLLEVKGTAKQPVSGYSPDKRAYPDVALLGHAYVIVTDGQYINVDGTSASAPVMAGFAALVNAARKARNLSTLGWLNPALYATADAFIHDIVAGNNNCTASSVCCSQGFYAASGWDPVTGLGSVMFDKFFTTLSTLQSLNNTDYDDFAFQTFSVDDDTAQLSTGAVVGIVVAVVVVILLLCVLIGYFCISAKATPMAAQQENPIAVAYVIN